MRGVRACFGQNYHVPWTQTNIKKFFEFVFENFTYFLRILENNEVRRTSSSFFGVFNNYVFDIEIKVK
jgi:hypothetical protein